MGMSPRHRSELSVAIIGAFIGGVLGLAGVFWQTENGARHMQQTMRHDAIKEFLTDYSIAFVELQHYGDMRLPVTSLDRDDEMAARKHAHGVEGACARLLLVAPDLKDPAENLRSVLIAWEEAIEGPARYDNAIQANFTDSYQSALGAFLAESTVALDLPESGPITTFLSSTP